MQIRINHQSYELPKEKLEELFVQSEPAILESYNQLPQEWSLFVKTASSAVLRFLQMKKMIEYQKGVDPVLQLLGLFEGTVIEAVDHVKVIDIATEDSPNSDPIINTITIQREGQV